MKKASFCIITLFILCDLWGQQDLDYFKTDLSVGYQDLVYGFNNPPIKARMRCYWKWLNSMVTRESITRDLQEFKAKGYGGVLINDGGNSSSTAINQNPPWNITGPLYLSEEWRELFKHVIREADRLDLEVSVTAGSGWNPGGPFIDAEHAFKKLVYSETTISGGRTIKVILPKPDTLLMYRDILVQAVRCVTGKIQAGDSVIRNWSIKTFNKSFGSQGIYPLQILREDYDDDRNACILSPDEILDITPFFDGSELNWEAPEGNWTIIRYGYTCKGTRTSTTSKGWEGLSLDHLSAKAFNLFDENVVTPLLTTAKSAGNSLKYIVTDSWEMGVTNWTCLLPEEFKKFRGYEIQKYMPVLTGRIVENRSISNRFLRDFRRTVYDCIAENHYRLLSAVAHKNNVGFHPESGGPHAAPIDAMQLLGINDFPQGEFWIRSNTHRVTDAQRFAVKQSASVAHTYGKRVAAAEGPQCIGPKWERAPKDMKHDIDRAFCSGINLLFWTNSIASPQEFGVPGLVNFAANQLNPNITWWEQAGDFVSYINRCSFLLQQGMFVADVLYYYGDDVPNFVFLKEEYSELQAGYDWDKCTREVIIERADVKDGKIVLPDGMTYRVLVLPPDDAIDVDVLKKVEFLVKKGATIISPRPVRASSLNNFPESDSEVKELADLMWGNIDGKNITENRYGRGKIIYGRNINEVLASMEISKDFSYVGGNTDTKLDYIHRKTDNQDIYFVVNRFAYKGINDFGYYYKKENPDRFETVECSFRVKGKVPELWNPVTGEIKKITAYNEENGLISIPVQLGPEASVFIIFREEQQNYHIVGIEKNGKKVFPAENSENITELPVEIYNKNENLVADFNEDGNYSFHSSYGTVTKLRITDSFKEVTLNSPWVVHFDPKWKGPESVIFPELKSWIEMDDPDIKYYSGKATYINKFKVEESNIKNKKIILDLGNVQELAVIRLNGHTCPVLWLFPFKQDITEFVLPGENTLEIDIINQWPNRLIGDSKLPENERVTRTNYKKFYEPDSEKYLRESGLIGPVKLQYIARRKIEKKIQNK